MLWTYGMQSVSRHCILWMIWGVLTYKQDQLACLLYSAICMFWILGFMSPFLTWSCGVYLSFFPAVSVNSVGGGYVWFFLFWVFFGGWGGGGCWVCVCVHVVVHTKKEQNEKTAILEISCILLITIASLQSGMIISELSVCRFIIVLE